MKKIDCVLQKAATAHYWSMGLVFNEEKDKFLFHFFNLNNDLICVSPIYPNGGIPSYYLVIKNDENGTHVEGPFGEEIDRISVIVDELEK